ncbi:MAG: polymer-forming cytoskeletal protein [Clostridia bacterium]|jgi:hypothetical protein|nr:polymer-forming cytoskeletal protein [Clostridia bacterium]
MKLIHTFIFFILIFSLLLSPLCIASSEPTTSTDNETIKVFNTDLYLGGQDIVVNDAVNGNVFASGSTVTIKGEILGDIFVIAKSLTIDETATIHGNVFAFANDITINGKVNYDVYFLGQDFELADSGYINRDIRIFAANIKLYGSIKKDAFLFVDSVLMAENAEDIIGGNLYYTSTQESTFPEKAIIGSVKFTQYQGRTTTTGEIIAKYVKQFISNISLALVIILFAVFLAPKFTEKVNYALMKRPFVSAGIGILAIVFLPVLAFFLLFTGYLTALALVIAVLYGLILAASLAIFSLALAKSFADKWNITSKGKLILIAFLCSIVLWIVKLLPTLGTYVSLFIAVVGLGMFLTSFIKVKEKN